VVLLLVRHDPSLGVAVGVVAIVDLSWLLKEKELSKKNLMLEKELSKEMPTQTRNDKTNRRSDGRIINEAMIRRPTEQTDQRPNNTHHCRSIN